MHDKYISLTKLNNVKNSYGKDISDSIKPLISNTNKLNKLEKYTQVIFDIDKDTIDKLIEKIYEEFINQDILKIKDKNNKLYQISANEFNLHNYKSTK